MLLVAGTLVCAMLLSCFLGSPSTELEQLRGELLRAQHTIRQLQQNEGGDACRTVGQQCYTDPACKGSCKSATVAVQVVWLAAG